MAPQYRYNTGWVLHIFLSTLPSGGGGSPRSLLQGPNHAICSPKFVLAETCKIIPIHDMAWNVVYFFEVQTFRPALPSKDDHGTCLGVKGSGPVVSCPPPAFYLPLVGQKPGEGPPDLNV